MQKFVQENIFYFFLLLTLPRSIIRPYTFSLRQQFAKLACPTWLPWSLPTAKGAETYAGLCWESASHPSLLAGLQVWVC